MLLSPVVLLLFRPVMAQLHPSIPEHLPKRQPANAGEHAELEVLQTLERGLSGAYILFHSVDWSRGVGEGEQHGEVDIVVVNQAGDVLLIEVKAGLVDFLPEGIFKTYGTSSAAKNVTAQIGLQYGALRGRLADAGIEVALSHLLILPHLQVQSETAQWPRERIIDSTDMLTLVSRVGELIGPGAPKAELQSRVLAFFGNRFRVAPDVSALSGRLQQTATRMAAGLATWVPRISTASGLIRVVGTAGSGKTQLALRLLSEADAAGHKAAYLCFNRALADHMACVVPVRTPAETFHDYARNMLKSRGVRIDFGQPGAFDALVTQCMAALEDSAPDLDLLVLDEMQDLQPDWVQALLGRLKTNGRALLLEDPQQQLYSDRESFDLPDAVTITANENFRSPRSLVQLINLLRLTDTEVEALGPHEGELADPIVYKSAEGVAAATQIAVQRCLQRGFELADIAVVSLRGREGSALRDLDRLGSWPLRRFTGRYDEGGAPVWTDGALLLDTVRRFKGQAAPAVVLTDCDLTELSPLNRRLLFVGLTRAQVHLEWVISAGMAAMLAEWVSGVSTGAR